MKKEYIVIAILVLIIAFSFINFKGKEVKYVEIEQYTTITYFNKRQGTVTIESYIDDELAYNQVLYLQSIVENENYIGYRFENININYDKETKEYQSSN